MQSVERRFTDPADPRTWHSLMLQAIAGIRSQDFVHARSYIAFVRQHRGEAQVEKARENLTHYAKSEAFDDALDQLRKLECPAEFVAAPLVTPAKRRKK